ncbi:Dabb family protein [Kriegella aquimaris]|uniref:Stress responsive A/B Barrel Domain n=1 Tax=Kriegella aquimaris TaxID=192904 RepID=A0A1G9XM67_9FLAO|nr:Dabb family protein [Kriegella aquimaris]SDM97922.1 Stress responsive A/B Barrel Domain [Kriegella aquimaris]
MKNIGFTLLFMMSFSVFGFSGSEEKNDISTEKIENSMAQDSLLRHVVLFKFKEGTAPEKIKEIEDAFAALPSKIPQIISYEWGLNNSPEGLNKGLTHCFFLTFKSEEDRAIYLPHPDHKAFGALLSGHLDDVTVVDYWASK